MCCVPVDRATIESATTHAWAEHRVAQEVFFLQTSPSSHYVCNILSEWGWSGLYFRDNFLQDFEKKNIFAMLFCTDTQE